MIKLKCIFLLFLVCSISNAIPFGNGDANNRWLPETFSSERITPEGRSIISSIWGWISSPFSWLGTSNEQPGDIYGPNFPTPGLPQNPDVEVTKRNITVWCNDHTCTTMKCDQGVCLNTTCSVYDTDLDGQCKTYNTTVDLDDKPTKPYKPVEPKPTEAVTPPEATEPATIEDKTTKRAQVKPINHYHTHKQTKLTTPSKSTTNSKPPTKSSPNDLTTGKTEKSDDDDDIVIITQSPDDDHPIDLEAVMSSTVGKSDK